MTSINQKVTTMKYKSMREEELKNKVAADWFSAFDTTEILGNIDFTIFSKQETLFERAPLLWAEAKTGDFDLAAMFVQLILTICSGQLNSDTILGCFQPELAATRY
jgi:hypothetical protein